jgi:hypothetical protein
MRTMASFSFATLLIPAAILLITAKAASAEQETVTVGPWTIATSYKADKFENCAMSRTTNNLGITFVRSQDGLALLLDSSKWQLDRGKAYTIELIAGSRSVEAKAQAESKSVSIDLSDRKLNERIRSLNFLEVKGEGATLRVPLDASSAGLERLETCFDKNSHAGAESNPFVAPKRSP